MKSFYAIFLGFLFTHLFFPGFGQSGNLNVGNLVWNDADGDGRKDPNEYAIGGITVSLYADADANNLPDGSAITTAVTSTQGLFNFTGLKAGRYIISIPVIPGYRPGGIATTSGNPDNNVDNDNNGVRNEGGVLYSNAITLSAGDEPANDGDGSNGNLTFDIALCGNSAIGDFVWYDANCNGIQDAGENGINGATVTITYPDGTTASELTHNYNGVDGYYDFVNVGPGTYTITFTTPAGYTSSPSNAGSDDAKDSDPVNGAGVLVTITADESDFTIDAGYCKGAANLNLGNLVWNDSDGDGRKDPNEYVIGGIAVSLYRDDNADNLPDGAAIGTSVTTINGIYSFTGLTAGRYIISIPILPGYVAGGIASTSNDPDNNVDNDNNGVRKAGEVLFSNAITLSAGDEPTTDGDGSNGNLTFDIALCGNSAIGDFVWHDANCNGIQDAGEKGINDAIVTITYADGTTASELTHTFNGKDGYYDFTNLGPGTYKITFTTPALYAPSPANAGSDNSKDSDPVNGAPVSVTIGINESNFTIDAGFCKGLANLNLGNLVWNDSDGDGRKDPNEYAIGGITVSLYADNDSDNLPDGAAIKTTVTDANGIYSFTGLTAGRYIISIPILAGYVPGGVLPSSYDPDNNVDNDNNGVRSAGGVLYSNAITLSAGDEPTTDGDGSNGNLTFDIALCGNSAIGDFVWFDINCNGIQDAGEVGINDVVVTITYPDGTTATELTHNYNGQDGYYDLINIGPGTYTITFTTPSGYTPSPANVGSDDSKDSDPINGAGVSVTIGANQSDFTIDAGYCRGIANLNLGNLVWNDSDGDGRKDPNEYAIGGITVSLYTDNDGNNLPDGGAIKTTVTNINGIYSFTGLPAGRYIISIPVLAGYVPGGIAATSNDPDNNVDNDNNGVKSSGGILYSNAITLSAGDEPTTDGDDSNGNLTFDIALCGNSAVGDFVWHDANCNGIQDAGENGINDVSVTITYPDGTTAIKLTHNYLGKDGYYDFINIGPGTYTITFTTPAGYNPAPSNVGADDSIDSDPINGSATTTIAANESDFTIDAGYCAAGAGALTLGNLVWNDSNDNGVKDIDEHGVSGATVNLYRDTNGDNVPDGAPIATTTTANGFYGFSGLSAGKYIVGVVVPSGYVKGAPAATGNNPDNNVDNDNNGVILSGGEIRTNFITLAPGTEPTNDGDGDNGNLTLDIALKGGATIGNYVWADVDKDGIQDANEVGIANATVGLVAPDGTIRTTTTNAAGLYSFRALGPGTYTVQFVTPAAMTPSPANVGDDTKDTDPVNGEVSVTLAANETNNTIDAGFYRETCPPSPLDTDGDCIPDVIDIDDDNDGILDVVESGGYDPLEDCDGDGIINYKDPTPGCAVPPGTDVFGQPYTPIVWTDCNGDGINDYFDWDRDGIINELDLDSDNDGILDVQEARDPKATDDNRDGMVDGIDNDNDGLLSTADANDNDPSIAASIGLIPEDLDRDGTPNYLDLDSDGDGIVDNREALELDVFAPAYTGLAMGTNDDDHDGVRTVSYTANDNDADNIKGFGAKGILLRDNDGDGFPNPYDIDTDNDGITDNVEGQPTCSEVQPWGIDVDGDGLDDAYDTDLNTCVRKAPGITPYDKEFDGTPDIRDLDTDNDGAPDINEGSGIYSDFVTNYNDTDGDGLIDQFDIFNIKTATSLFVNNVAHSEMGPGGNFDGPVPAGSNAPLPQTEVGSCPDVDRDWRNVTILPVSLIEFKGALASKLVKLQWTVENEVNMSHYIIERSTNGQTFTDIGRVAARGNSTVSTMYQLDDDLAMLNGSTVYYRLKEVEKTGSTKLSTILTFKLTNKPEITFSLYPNPASSYTVFKINALKNGTAAVRVTDVAGKTMLLKNARISTGSNAITFNDISALSSGIYNVQLMIDGHLFNQKLVVTK